VVNFHYECDLAIIGAGPAGLRAAVAAAESGASVILLDRDLSLGGQLIKQTHMFFGSQKQHASVRGIDIAGILLDEIEKHDKIKVLPGATALGMYEDGMLTAEHKGKYIKIKARAFIVATGASEKFLTFPNNDLPGIYGAGAVQTLMNVYGVTPGDNVVMVGAGNIGLIVSYQLVQAGVNVRAVIDAAQTIGGYLVHASKIRRMGVPIYTGHTVKQAHGTDKLEKVTLIELDKNWKQIEGTEKDIEADVLCISVGLSPLGELLWQMGCEMKYIPELSGHVPVRNVEHQTSVKNVFVCGDVAGVEEASSAMVGGSLAGLCAAKYLGFDRPDFEEQKADCLSQFNDLRSGPVGERILSGIHKIECGGVQ